jgi:hypothetical protein
VIVPGASAPGQKKAPAPTAPTQKIARYADATALAPRPPRAPGARRPAPRPGRRRSGARRFFGALLALVLILAVPVISAYVSYKLTEGGSPFEWPPTMDLSNIF